MEVDAASGDSLYRSLTSLVVPRPIGWISTVSAEGRDNLAPFSYFNAVSGDPPTVLFSAGERDGQPKDSARFAVETGEFVANLVTEDLVESMDATSAPVAESEFDVVGLERRPAETVAPPRVAEAAACLECSVVETVSIGANTVVFGEVQHLFVDESLLTDGKVDSKKVDAIGRLGGPYYTRIDRLDFTRQH